jgi:5-methyltetrahydrofolate--homocysteine methyltransferase
MKADIKEAIRGGVLLADGGIGTELGRLGLTYGACCELWNIERPEIVEQVHRAYIHAGARMITTNSFRANRLALGRHGLEDRTRELNLSAAKIARRAAGDTAWVMGSLGPLGETISQSARLSASAFDAFVEQARSLIEGGVDAIIIETMSFTEELKTAVGAAREAGACFVIAMMVFAGRRGDYKTIGGQAIEEAARAMTASGADVVGCNCGVGLAVEDYSEIVARLRSFSDKPIIAEPNAGQPELVGDEFVYSRGEPRAMAAGIKNIIRAGANIIGGCCGTTPDHISQFGRQIERG